MPTPMTVEGAEALREELKYRKSDLRQEISARTWPDFWPCFGPGPLPDFFPDFWPLRFATVILSRAVDDTGYVQPTREALLRVRGAGAIPYHNNPITGWRLRAGGDVVYRVEEWA